MKRLFSRSKDCIAPNCSRHQLKLVAKVATKASRVSRTSEEAALERKEALRPPSPMLWLVEYEPIFEQYRVLTQFHRKDFVTQERRTTLYLLPATYSKLVNFSNASLQNAGGDEITYLPTIVEGAEASPAAAGAAAYQIRKLIKDGYSKPYIQYNCIMLMRILVDNPGPQFTSHLDSKFILTIKTCLQSSRDPSVQQILRESLYYFASTKQSDTNIGPLLNMWQQEQTAYPGGRSVGPGPSGSHPPREHHSNRNLPPPEELAARISEAKASAQLLIQLSESTPPYEVPGNELMKEFADRVQSANRNLHAFMNCQDPPPDEHTFATLIETCEQLSVASSRHQRAVLASRQQLGLSTQQSNGASPQPPQIVQPVQNHQYQPRGLTPHDQQRASYIPPTATMNPSEQQRSSYMQPPSNMMASQPQGYSRGFEQPRASNPFSDDNSIPSQAPQLYNTNTKPTSHSTVYELPGSTDEDSTAPSKRPVINGTRNLQTQQPQSALQDDEEDYDLYNTGNSPLAAHHARPMPQQPEALNTPTSTKPTNRDSPQTSWNHIASTARTQQPAEMPAPEPAQAQASLAPSRPDIPGVTQSYVGRQYQAASGMTMHGASPPSTAAAAADGAGLGPGGKIRDDEPITPITPSGWH